MPVDQREISSVYDDITYDEFLLQNPASGELKVQASRGRQTMPMPDVQIYVSQLFSGSRVLFHSGKTDQNGLLGPILLPAPPRSESLDPGFSGSGAVYEVYAYQAGYRPERYEVEIFSGVLGILPVTLRLAEEV